jgi:TRAP-type C4-dicarboxylate transport system permease small subunit
LTIVFYQSLIVSRLLWPTDLPMLGISQAWFYIPLMVIFPLMMCHTIEFIMIEFISPEE